MIYDLKHWLLKQLFITVSTILNDECNDFPKYPSTGNCTWKIVEYIVK